MLERRLENFSHISQLFQTGVPPGAADDAMAAAGGNISSGTNDLPMDLDLAAGDAGHMHSGQKMRPASPNFRVSAPWELLSSQRVEIAASDCAAAPNSELLLIGQMSGRICLLFVAGQRHSHHLFRTTLNHDSIFTTHQPAAVPTCSQRGGKKRRPSSTAC